MAKKIKDDYEFFREIKKNLFTAVVGDILDTMGFYHQFLPQAIKPIDKKMVIVGRAMPVLESDHWSQVGGNTPISQKSFGYMLEALDDLKPQEVYIATGSSLNYALWGGLMSTRATHLKAAGVICDGFHRDTNEILEINFPCFSRGSYAQDQAPRGKVVDWRLPIKIDAVKINPGDLIYGDEEGVLVVPKEAEEEVFTRAFEKVKTESKVRIAIKRGMSTVEAFNKFGVM